MQWSGLLITIIVTWYMLLKYSPQSFLLFTLLPRTTAEHKTAATHRNTTPCHIWVLERNSNGRYKYVLSSLPLQLLLLLLLFCFQWLLPCNVVQSFFFFWNCSQLLTMVPKTYFHVPVFLFFFLSVWSLTCDRTLLEVSAPLVHRYSLANSRYC